MMKTQLSNLFVSLYLFERKKNFRREAFVLSEMCDVDERTNLINYLYNGVINTIIIILYIKKIFLSRT